MRLTLLGLGLIGGSIARAVRAAGGWKVTAWTPDGRGPGAAFAAGAIDDAATTLDAAIAGADLVVVASPPLAALELVRGLGRTRATRGITVTDVVSTKGAITAVARDAGLPFVGGHPMAGRETSGFGAASADLFVDRAWVITEAVHGGDPGRVEQLVHACRAIPVRLDAVRHDRAVAAISHLPLLASVALVEAVLDGGDPVATADARALAASGWRDMTRLARGDAAMGAGIVATNRPALAAALRRYRDRIDAWIGIVEGEGGASGEQVDGRDAEAIRALLEAARNA